MCFCSRDNRPFHCSLTVTHETLRRRGLVELPTYYEEIGACITISTTHVLSCSQICHADGITAGMQSAISFKCIMHHLAVSVGALVLYPSPSTGAQNEQMPFSGVMLCSMTAAVYRTAIRPAVKQQITHAACSMQVTPAQEAADFVQSTQHESLPHQTRWSQRTQHM